MVCTPTRRSPASATGPTPHSARTGSGSSTACSLGRRHHPQPVRFGQLGGDLGELLAGAGADRGRQAGGAADRGPQLRRRTAATSAGVGPGQVGWLQERLVQRHRLQHRGGLGQHGHHPLGQRLVEREPRRQDHGLRAQPPGLPHRHRRAGAEHPGLVAGAGHHGRAGRARRPAPAGRASGGPGQLLDGGVERVHVEVQHPPAPATVPSSAPPPSVPPGPDGSRTAGRPRRSASARRAEQRPRVVLGQRAGGGPRPATAAR